MNDKNSSPFQDFDWLEAQRNYMQAWASFCQGTDTNSNSTASKPGNIPWAQAMDFWWQSVKGACPDKSRDFFGKMVEQTRAFYQVSDQLTRFMSAVADINKATEDWQDKLAEHFTGLKSFFTRQSEAVQSFNGIMGAWHLMPMDTLHRTISSASFMPGDFLQNFKPDGMQGITDKFLSMPGVGYTRESQEQFQEGIRLWSEYQKTQQEHHNALCGVAVKALETMHERILAMAKIGKKIDSLREIYDLWVDCNEDAYAKLVFSEGYSKLYGRLVNSLMAVKQHGRNLVDETLTAMNMPTQRGLDTVKKRQQELRRELASIKATNEQGAGRMQRMESQLARLKGELEMLKSAAGRVSGIKAEGATLKTVTNKVSASGKQQPAKKIAGRKSVRKKTTRKIKAAGKKVANKTG